MYLLWEDSQMYIYFNSISPRLSLVRMFASKTCFTSTLHWCYIDAAFTLMVIVLRRGGGAATALSPLVPCSSCSRHLNWWCSSHKPASITLRLLCHNFSPSGNISTAASPLHTARHDCVIQSLLTDPDTGCQLLLQNGPLRLPIHHTSLCFETLLLKLLRNVLPLI